MTSIQPIIARREVTTRILQAFHLKADKNLGQNFLVEETVVNRIARAAELTPDDTVLEIGPGIGTLTQSLALTGAQVVAVCRESLAAKVRGQVDEVIVVPDADDLLAPLLAVIPLQLFAYCMAVARGCDVDKPRNLAKSVTVE